MTKRTRNCCILPHSCRIHQTFHPCYHRIRMILICLPWSRSSRRHHRKTMTWRRRASRIHPRVRRGDQGNRRILRVRRNRRPSTHQGWMTKRTRNCCILPHSCRIHQTFHPCYHRIRMILICLPCFHHLIQTWRPCFHHLTQTWRPCFHSCHPSSWRSCCYYYLNWDMGNTSNIHMHECDNHRRHLMWSCCILRRSFRIHRTCLP